MNGEDARRLFAGEPTWALVDSEMEELRVAAARGNLVEFLEEVGDVWVTVAALIYNRRGWSLPIWWWGKTSAAKWQARIDVWAAALESLRIPFEHRFLQGGSNYEKAAKRRLVLEAALGREPTAHEVGLLEAHFVVWKELGVFPTPPRVTEE